MCHMSHVMCHMSHAMCRESHVIYIYINFFDNVMKLVVGGSVISYINPVTVTTIISITYLVVKWNFSKNLNSLLNDNQYPGNKP